MLAMAAAILIGITSVIIYIFCNSHTYTNESIIVSEQDNCISTDLNDFSTIVVNYPEHSDAYIDSCAGFVIEPSSTGHSTLIAPEKLAQYINSKITNDTLIISFGESKTSNTDTRTDYRAVRSKLPITVLTAAVPKYVECHIGSMSVILRGIHTDSITVRNRSWVNVRKSAIDRLNLNGMHNSNNQLLNIYDSEIANIQIDSLTRRCKINGFNAPSVNNITWKRDSTDSGELILENIDVNTFNFSGKNLSMETNGLVTIGKFTKK